MPSTGHIDDAGFMESTHLFQIPEQRCRIPRVRNIQRSFATLKYELTAVEVSIETAYAKEVIDIVLCLSFDSTIKEMIAKVAEQENIPIEVIQLTQNEHLLADDISLPQLLSVPKPAPIYLILKPSTVRIVTEFGADIIVDTLTLFDTVKDVKEAIAKKVGISYGLQTLRFNENTLNDGDVLSFIGNEGSLHLVLSPIKINVKTAHSHYPSLVFDQIKPSTTVKDFRKMINRTSKCNAKVRRLIFRKRNYAPKMQTLELCDDRRLFYYNMIDGDTIYLSASDDSVILFVDLFFTPPFCFDLKPYDQIKDLKDEWINKVVSISDKQSSNYTFWSSVTEQSSFSIKLPGGKLLNDIDLVAHYDLSTFFIKRNCILIDGSGLQLGLNDRRIYSIPILIRNTCMKTVKDLKDTLSNRLKRHINVELPPDVYFLTFNDQMLCDELNLVDYQIKDGSLIKAELKEATPAISVVAHDQSHGGTGVCYAYAIATVLRAAEKRIIGRHPPKHNVVANQLISIYGENGASSKEVLKIECPLRQLRWMKVNREEAGKQLDRKHVLLGRFRLDKRQWDYFCRFFIEKKRMILRNTDLPLNDGIGVEGHAVAIYEDSEDEDYWRIKNSWGSEWGNNGFCKIGKNAIRNFKIYHVFYCESDLTEKDKQNYMKYVTK